MAFSLIHSTMNSAYTSPELLTTCFILLLNIGLAFFSLKAFKQQWIKVKSIS